jgi:ribonuclease D
MPDAIWIDRTEQLPEVARALANLEWIGVDTEFLRERTFFPKLCVLQISGGEGIWCIDALQGSLDALVPALTAGGTRKVIHSARQDLEAFYLTTRRVISPVFDTQVAAGIVGMKPQIGYAELVQSLIGVTLPKGQTRTDWSKRPLSKAQLDYAAEDVLHLGQIAALLQERLRELGRAHWALEDCLALENPALYEPDPSLAWERLRGLAQLDPATRSRAKAIAVWREKLARDKDLPRSWILADPALFELARRSPRSADELRQLRDGTHALNADLAAGLFRVLMEEAESGPADLEPGQDLRPTPQQKAMIERLGRTVDARAAELVVSPEVLAPRGELKALALGRRDTDALSGWRREIVGLALLADLESG